MNSNSPVIRVTSSDHLAVPTKVSSTRMVVNSARQVVDSARKTATVFESDKKNSVASEDDNQKLQSQVSDLTRANKRLETNNRMLNNENRDHKKNIKRLDTDLANTQLERDRYRRLSEKQEKEIEELRSQILSLKQAAIIEKLRSGVLVLEDA